FHNAPATPEIYTLSLHDALPIYDGQECWLLIHIEVQGQPEAGFAERMFVYNYRAYDLYNRPVVSLAVLCDAQPQWRPDRFTYERWGCTMGIVFPVVKLLDYAERGDELERSTNPFAAIVLAHVKAKTGRATKTSAGDRGALPVLESETFHL